MMLDKISTVRKTGNEHFLNGGEGSLLDYWAWAHSDIMGNTERGVIAEYLVAMAVDVYHGTRVEWDNYDVITDDGIKIEVKSSGYLQTWEQKDYSKIIFGVNPSQAWHEDTGLRDSVKKRQSDVYVFCVHNSKDQNDANPLDLNQWDFYVVSTKELNKRLPEQKTISLAGIKLVGAIQSDFARLRETIHEAYGE